MTPPILEAQRWSNADFYQFYFVIILIATIILMSAPWMFSLPPDPNEPKPERLRKLAASIRDTGRRWAAFLLRG